MCMTLPCPLSTAVNLGQGQAGSDLSIENARLYSRIAFMAFQNLNHVGIFDPVIERAVHPCGPRSAGLSART